MRSLQGCAYVHMCDLSFERAASPESRHIYRFCAHSVMRQEPFHRSPQDSHVVKFGMK